MRRVALVVVSAVALVSAALAGPASAGYEGPNPCKLLKRGEVQRAMGQPTAKAKKGFSAGALSSCEFDVSAADGQPDGTVSVSVQDTGAKIAFDANSELPGAEPVTGISKSYYDTNFGALTMLKGDLLVTVQSVFISSEGGIGQVDRKAETVELAKIAKKRA